MRQTSKDKNREVMIISTVVIALVVALAIHTKTLRKTDEMLAAKEAVLQERLEEESERSEELEEKSIFVQTREFIEQIARERLGLVNPNDTVIRPDD